MTILVPNSTGLVTNLSVFGPSMGYLSIMPVNARDIAGTSRDKAGTNKDKAGTNKDKAGTNRDKQGQSLSVRACPCLSLSVPDCPYRSLSVLVCPCQSLSVLVSPCLSLYVYTFAIPAFLPLQMIFTDFISVNIGTVTWIAKATVEYILIFIFFSFL